MVGKSNIREQAKALLDAGNLASAGALYHQLWDAEADAFSGGRYAYCLRKSGYSRQALAVAQKVRTTYPDDVYVRRELVWAIYDAAVRPARDQCDLGELRRSAQRVLDLTDEEVPTRLVVFAVVDVAKAKGRWDVVCEWCDKLDSDALSSDAREMGGRRVISEREQWYYAKVKSLVELERWEAAREMGLEAYNAYPRKGDFCRWAARAVARLGHTSLAISELEALVCRGEPQWYVLHDLASLKYAEARYDEAYSLACRAALASGQDRAKVGLYLLISQTALALDRTDVANRHLALCARVRAREGWRETADLARLRREIEAVLAPPNDGLADVLDNLPELIGTCRADWEQEVPIEPSTRSTGNRTEPVLSVTADDDTVHTGRIKTYFEDRGFGFIAPDRGGNDLFFHIKSVRGVALPSAGTRVTYRIEVSDRGPRAACVSLT